MTPNISTSVIVDDPIYVHCKNEDNAYICGIQVGGYILITDSKNGLVEVLPMSEVCDVTIIQPREESTRAYEGHADKHGACETCGQPSPCETVLNRERSEKVKTHICDRCGWEVRKDGETWVGVESESPVCPRDSGIRGHAVYLDNGSE